MQAKRKIDEQWKGNKIKNCSHRPPGQKKFNKDDLHV
jgi:hypothetical protein